MKKIKILLTVFLLSFTLFINTCYAYVFVNKDYEQQVGSQYAAQIESQAEIITGNAMFNDVVYTLWRNFSPNSPSYRFRIINDKSLNAFCVPGGYIYVTVPMMNYVNSRDELSFIVAHEIGHQQNEHFLREVDNALTTQFGFALLGAVLKQQQLADITHQMIAKSTSRGFGFKKEFEADTYGFDLMVKSGYNPGAGALFFFKLRRDMGEGESNDPRQPGYLNPHPANSKRLAKQLELLTNYSNNKVSIKGSTIYVNGIRLFTPVPYKQYTSEERAYIVGGFLAQVYHKNPNAKFYITDKNSLASGDQVVYANREEMDLNPITTILNK